ncbi:GNAT family N-acetyltransferase [Runella slithyformis]|uniref:BioF2-like acetyltransferase domain-containing protein n=1 Tax=Runella slithyformis (strain ATCC 29530 / DSM 19594 / LMG 11500 / NCIMB 11436 / LSU 4) TaxID=761193 RepID=A0A7U3ZQL5_RUNSL|nr:GNAT family N-acetyltransferase [Runella slithyformis]AEI51555.1 hypothetical protein Runsl_5256 [Runella slithyformis DSM 19594]
MSYSIPQQKVTSFPLRDYTAQVVENNPDVLHRYHIRWALWLFNTPLHVKHQHAAEVYTFILTDTATQTEVFGVFHLFIEHRQGISPFQASFGSFEMAERISHAEFGEWLTGIELFAKELGLSSLCIKHYPSCYNPSRTTFIRRGLTRHGFTIPSSTENQFIPVIQDRFEEGLHASERRRLRKCLRAGFRFEEWLNPPAEEVYRFIEHNRQLLGYALSFSFEQLQLWLSVFPDHFRVFCVKDGDTLASLTLTVRVGESVLYNFCPADNLTYRTYSPTVLLTKGLYEECRHKGISLLDLGISVNETGAPKPSLKRFKENLGAKNCDKYVFHKVLS